MKTRKIMVRIGTVLLLSIIIWRFISYLNGKFLGDEYNHTAHFFIALTTTILCLILIDTVRRIDKISWKYLGLDDLRTNIISFFIGIILWAIPAAIGLIICLMTGWVEIKVITTDLNQLLLSILILFITVFFIEAFPEELVLRGYIYSYLNSLFPHKITLFIQSLIFSLFAYFIGAIYSLDQLLFIPSYGLMLGYFRAKSGNVWTSIGFHAAIMTATQILNLAHNHFHVSGAFALRFFAFNLLPYMLGAIALELIYPKHNWNETVLICDD
ncbi:CPBP family intramembrane metalloprotease [Alkaliphilus sp. MSJ-5]|uniref:CPBP family intramembrane metalloprotease n=1 Tax=Alkaliphilus flagellatus TaxID=2841507 RepID=A0ABS6G326_9FIRM|nr:type II CAAX endopeptidase family protein [Alkaliphilus flagellatus]MBU5676895.1 CPBP family intramembrane metalloprotease [Alkaliphilus flagellatus]